MTTIETADLLGRLAETLRTEIGPAVGDDYTRTQAHMAGVILERVGRQLRLAPAHADAERGDMDGLLDELGPSLSSAPDDVTAAVEAARASGRVGSLTPLIDALYRWGIDRPAAADALARVRSVLRRDIDRRMEVAR